MTLLGELCTSLVLLLLNLIESATPSALVNAKCSDLTWLCIDNLHLFLKEHAAIFNPISGDDSDQVIFSDSSQVLLQCYLCPHFYFESLLEVY